MNFRLGKLRKFQVCLCLKDRLWSIKANFLRMRELYKSFRESMDSYCIVSMNPDFKKVWFLPYDMNLGFVSYHGSRIWIWKDSFCIVHTNPANFQKIWPVFTNPTNPYKSSRILVHRSSTNPNKSCASDSQIHTVFKRFVLWIHFVDLVS